MKKLLVFLSVILVLTLTVSSFSLFAWALEPVQHPSFNYDNSVWVTLQTEDSCSVEQLQTLLKVETCYIMDKQTKEGTVTYQLVVGKEGESVEATIERMKAVEGVTNAGRNVYAGDYAQKESYLTLNQTELVIPVGGTANLQIVDAKLVQTEQSAVGVMVEVDHEILSYEQFRSIVETYRIWEGMKDAPYVMAFFEDDSEVVWEDMYLHTEYFGWPDEEFLTEERLNNPSPIGKYIIDPYTEHVIWCKSWHRFPG